MGWKNPTLIQEGTINATGVTLHVVLFSILSFTQKKIEKEKMLQISLKI